jgi:HK97 gp10 family phage protein
MASDIKFTWNGPAITKQFVAAADRGVFKAAHIWRNEYIRLILGTPKTGHIYGDHQASAPGEPPASDTGRLIRSVDVRHKPGTATAIVGVGAEHAKYLEFGTAQMAARPAFRPAYANKRKDMIAAISNEIKKALK